MFQVQRYKKYTYKNKTRTKDWVSLRFFEHCNSHNMQTAYKTQNALWKVKHVFRFQSAQSKSTIILYPNRKKRTHPPHCCIGIRQMPVMALSRISACLRNMVLSHTAGTTLPHRLSRDMEDTPAEGNCPCSQHRLCP